MGKRDNHTTGIVQAGTVNGDVRIGRGRVEITGTTDTNGKDTVTNYTDGTVTGVQAGTINGNIHFD